MLLPMPTKKKEKKGHGFELLVVNRAAMISIQLRKHKPELIYRAVGQRPKSQASKTQSPKPRSPKPQRPKPQASTTQTTPNPTPITHACTTRQSPNLGSKATRPQGSDKPLGVVANRQRMAAPSLRITPISSSKPSKSSWVISSVYRHEYRHALCRCRATG